MKKIEKVKEIMLQPYSISDEMRFAVSQADNIDRLIELLNGYPQMAQADCFLKIIKL